MDKDLALKSYACSNTIGIEKIKKRGTKDPELSKGTKEILEAGTKIADVIKLCGYAQSLPRSLKIVKCGLDTLRLVDDTRRVWHVESNLDLLYEVRRALPLDGRNVAYNDVTLKYFYSDYGEYKNSLRDLDRKYILNKWKIHLLNEELSKPDVDNREEKEVALRKLKGINKSIECRVSRKQRLKERVINNEAMSINKHSEKRLFWKFGADILSFAANVVEVVTAPVLAAIALACRTPGMLYGICKKICNNENVDTREISMKDEHVLTILQLPSLVADFWNVIDKWVFKKLREKSEKARKEEVLDRQLTYVEDNYSRITDDDILSKMRRMKDIGDDKAKQKVLIEKLILVRNREIQEQTVQELERIREGISDMQLNMELDRDIEKQRRRLRKVEDEIIKKAERWFKYDEFTEEIRSGILEEVIKDVEAKRQELEIGKEGLRTLDLVFKESKKVRKVLEARPKKLYLKPFNIRTMEDEDRMRGIARFIINHIKNLPDVDNLSIEEVNKFDHNIKEVKNSYDRIEKMLKALNLDEEDGDAKNFINRVRAYKKNKGTVGAENKDDLVNDLVEKMKKEI